MKQDPPVRPGPSKTQLLPFPKLLDPVAQLNNLEKRVRDLERRVGPPMVPPFTALGVRSFTEFFAPKYRLRYDVSVVEVSITLGTAPNMGSATGGFYVNGSLVYSVTIPDGEYVGVLDVLEDELSAGDLLQVSVEVSPGFEADWVWQWHVHRLS